MDNKTLFYVYRRKLDKVSKDLVFLMKKRNKLSYEILKIKKRLKLPATDSKREKQIVSNIKKFSDRHGIDSENATKIVKIMIRDGKRFRSRRI